jgi:hypothetical protein
VSNIFAMQRANGDWFALEDHGRLCVPVFHSSHDALMARLRNFEMLLFSPIALDARLLNEIVAGEGGSKVDFCMVKDSFASLNRGNHLPHAQLALLISNLAKRPTVPSNGNDFNASALPLAQVATEATETWENEGGHTQSVSKATGKPGVRAIYLRITGVHV